MARTYPAVGAKAQLPRPRRVGENRPVGHPTELSRHREACSLGGVREVSKELGCAECDDDGRRLGADPQFREGT